MNLRQIVISSIAASLLCAGCLTSESAAARVTLLAITQPGVSPTAMHQWNKLLQNSGFDSVRIRSGREGEIATIKSSGTGKYAAHEVIGIINSKGELLLPKNRPISKTEISKLKEYVERLRFGGAEEIKRKKTTLFGLTMTEFLKVNAQLGPDVGFKTKDQNSFQVMQSIAQELPYEFSVPLSATTALKNNNVLDELEHVSCGCAIAAILRPLGYSLLPKRDTQGAITLHVIASNSAVRSWPIGWPPQETSTRVIPKLLKYLEVEIEDIPLDQAVTAIAGNLEAPVLLDHNQMAAQGIKLSEVKVRYPSGRAFYKKILDTILFQGKLTFEVRLDEAGHGVIWITTLKKN